MKVRGIVISKGNFEVDLDITQKEFEALSGREQTALVENEIDYREVEYYLNEIDDDFDY